MTRLTAKIATLVVAIAGVLVIGARFGTHAESKPVHAAVAIETSETTEAKIERAMSAGPPITIGPHWMIMWPFDPKTTGLPTTHKETGAFIM